MNLNMENFFTTHGLIHQTSCPHTPQQNGVAERKNRTLPEMSQTLLFEAYVPSFLWLEAIVAATYLTNRLPTKILKFKTPLETLHNHTTIPSFHSLPPRSLVVWFMFIYPNLLKLNLNPVLLSVFLWDMVLIRRVIVSLIQFKISFIRL